MRRTFVFILALFATPQVPSQQLAQFCDSGIDPNLPEPETCDEISGADWILLRSMFETCDTRAPPLSFRENLTILRVTQDVQLCGLLFMMHKHAKKTGNRRVAAKSIALASEVSNSLAEVEAEFPEIVQAERLIHPVEFLHPAFDNCFKWPEITHSTDRLFRH